MNSQVNQKRKQGDLSENLNNSDIGQSITKKLKKSQKFIIEVKLDKKWVGTSQSLHESLTLLSQSQGNCTKEVQNFLHESMSQSDCMNLSEITNQCNMLSHEFNQETNTVKLFMQPNKDFDYEKLYTTPSSTNYTENDSCAFDQEMRTSCFELTNFQVGQMNEEGL